MCENGVQSTVYIWNIYLLPDVPINRVATLNFTFPAPELKPPNNLRKSVTKAASILTAPIMKLAVRDLAFMALLQLTVSKPAPRDSSDEVVLMFGARPVTDYSGILGDVSWSLSERLTIASPSIPFEGWRSSQTPSL